MFAADCWLHVILTFAQCGPRSMSRQVYYLPCWEQCRLHYCGTVLGVTIDKYLDYVIYGDCHMKWMCDIWLAKIWIKDANSVHCSVAQWQATGRICISPKPNRNCTRIVVICCSYLDVSIVIARTKLYGPSVHSQLFTHIVVLAMLQPNDWLMLIDYYVWLTRDKLCQFGWIISVGVLTSTYVDAIRLPEAIISLFIHTAYQRCLFLTAKYVNESSTSEKSMSNGATKFIGDLHGSSMCVHVCILFQPFHF